ncbi:MAG TPA: diacylglycerol kinase [Cellvibrionaceae bacterium]|nr:diacylglycerol kinase [Cellvibrionaceae bacterium]HMW70470.1 diacylglycerol kinase [Cellvibrionaceae bacterium]HMY40654.1 diacylglycerol kinase [Marinagarivorans sp.]HNG60406.1 diacylglycerol kinase [Cellvibrionaceae bacterium]
MKPGNTGVSRLIHALTYSKQGLIFAYKNEAAFRQEIWLGVILIPVALLLPIGLIHKVTLIGSLILVAVVELLNSAIEAVVDRIGPEHNELAGRAKDMGSAAVMLTLVVVVLLWSAELYSLTR